MKGHDGERQAQADGVNPVRSENVVKRRIAGEVLLIPVSGRLADLEKIYVLDGAAEFVWDRLDGRPLEEIAEEMVRQYDVGREEASRDAADFIASLKKYGLVRELDKGAEKRQSEGG